jgi:long-chain acyl-CoA synthetase
VLLPNSSDLAIVTFAILAAGAQAVLLNPAYTVRELSRILEDADPIVVLYSESATEDQKSFLRSTGRGLKREIRLGELEDGKAEDVAFPLPTISPQDPCILQYTGGTTGRPKGVNLSHLAISTNVWQRQVAVPAREGQERVLCCMPLFHAFATSMCLLLTSYSAGCLIILERYSADLVLAALEQQRITIVPAGPTIFSGLLAHSGFTDRDFGSLRYCCSGSAPLSEETLRRWEKATGATIYEGYGMTETSPVLSFNPVGGTRKTGSAGLPLPLTDVEIVDAGDGDKVLGTGERGEVRVRGPQLMTHYRNLSTETADVMRGGWLYTGDIGVIDEDGYRFCVIARRTWLSSAALTFFRARLRRCCTCTPMSARPRPSPCQTHFTESLFARL